VTTSNISMRGVPLCELSDADIIGFFNERKAATGRRPIRKGTAQTWIEIMRSFDTCDVPMTVRQMFYQIEMKGLVPKTEQGYRKVARHLVNMRKEGVIPYRFIADLTRWLRKPQTYTGLNAALEETRKTYRRALWVDQPVQVEVWIEKEALIGVIAPVTETYDVPVFPCKGRPSLSFLHGAAEDMKDRGKKTFVYYFGDLDPHGVDIPRSVDEGIGEMGVSDYTLEVVALTREQVERWNLPERPTKRNEHDHLAKKWQGNSTELDAIPPQQLRALIQDCVERHIDPGILERTRRIEALERETLDRLLLFQFGTSTGFNEVSG